VHGQLPGRDFNPLEGRLLLRTVRPLLDSVSVSNGIMRLKQMMEEQPWLKTKNQSLN